MTSCLLGRAEKKRSYAKHGVLGSSRVRRSLARAMLAGAALLGALPALSGCSSHELVEDGSIRGEIVVYNATFADGTSQTQYFLRVEADEADERRLVFAADPDLTTGTPVKVWGDPSGVEIIVSHYQVIEDADPSGLLGQSREAIIDGPPYPPRTFALVRVDLGGGIDLSEAQANIDLFGTGANDGSVKQYFLEASYGRQDIGGSVVGPFSYQMSGCQSSQLANSLRDDVDDALPGIDIEHYLWYFGSNVQSCGWAGLAQVGTPTNPARDTWYNSSSSCVVLVQEPGHNFGMQHSSSLRCSGASFANDPSDCSHSEYGDRYDPMGGACRHMNAWQKGYQGWFGDCNSVRINRSGTYTLLPLEPECNGIQVLQIPMPVTNRTIPRSGGGGNPSNDPVQFYYLELRTRVGFDEPMTNAPTVLVRVAPDYRTLQQGGRHTWLLDMNPSTTGNNSFDGMGQGQSFTDPAGGVSFTVQSLSASSASIQVTVPTNSDNTCAFGSGTLEAPGPATCGATGGTGGMGGSGGGGMGGAGMGGAGAGGIGTSGSGGAGAGGVGPGGMGGAAGMDVGGAAGIDVGGGAGMAGLGGAGAVAGTGPAGASGAPLAGSGPGVAGAAGLGTAGSGGAATAGAPAAGAAGAGARPPAVGSSSGALDDGGCACRVPTHAPKNNALAAFGFAVLALGGLLRRRRRA